MRLDGVERKIERSFDVRSREASGGRVSIMATCPRPSRVAASLARDRSCFSRQMRRKQRLELKAFFMAPDPLRRGCPPLNTVEGRDGLNAQRLRRHGRSIDVHRHDLGAPAEFLRESFEFWRNYLAGTAPLGAELDQNGNFGA